LQSETDLNDKEAAKDLAVVEQPPILKRLLDLLINCMSLIELVQQNRFHYWER